MIYITKFDTSEGLKVDLKLTILNKTELEVLRETLKRTYKTKSINFYYIEK